MAYTIDKTYAFSANQGSSQRAQNLYIILHETDNAKATGANEAANMKNNYTPYTAYSTFVVGDGKVYQVGEPGYMAYAAGNANPYSPVQIELQHTTDPVLFKKNYAIYIELARDMAKKFGIPLTLDTGGAGTAGIKSHQWISNNIWGDHSDPYSYLASMGVSKAKLASDLANGTTTVTGGGSNSATPKPKPTPTPTNIPAGFEPENGAFVNGDTQIMNRIGAPSTSAQQGGYLPAYGTWPYDSWAKIGNFTWVHHMYGNQHVFLPVREWPSGKPYGEFK